MILFNEWALESMKRRGCARARVRSCFQWSGDGFAGWIKTQNRGEVYHYRNGENHNVGNPKNIVTEAGGTLLSEMKIEVLLNHDRETLRYESLICLHAIFLW